MQRKSVNRDQDINLELQARWHYYDRQRETEPPQQPGSNKCNTFSLWGIIAAGDKLQRAERKLADRYFGAKQSSKHNKTIAVSHNITESKLTAFK